MLAVLSTVRLHRVQAMMNLRQVLEAGAAAAFAIANPENHHFAEANKHGILDPSPELAKKRYRWLSKHYRSKSDWIKTTKDRINEWAAHANVVSSESIFRVGEVQNVASTPFFDVEDDYFVKADLWQSAAVALELMDLFYGVNRGRDVIAFHADFARHMERLARTTDALLDEQKASERYKRTMAKLAAAGITSRTP
jgi:CRISPR/Cas system CSM-associated protein Csm2 small subunit